MDKKTRDELDAYYTPRPIAMVMAERLNPKPGSKILDPMCGCGNLFKALEDMYPERNLTYLGFDIDEESLDVAREHFKAKGHFEVKSIFHHKIGELYNCDYIIMNPSFHYLERMVAIKIALQFNQGIIYVPFDELTLAAQDFKRLELREYDKDFLQDLFDCEIKYKQGTVLWSK